MNGKFLGLMSGTSCDAIDAAILEIENHDFSLVASREQAIPDDLREAVGRLSHPGNDEIEQLGALDRRLGELFATAANTLLEEAGLQANTITAIGSHGQTVRHRPPSAPGANGTPFTLQIGDPNTIAEHTGITTVADFRRRDIACGGEGAPLAPAFHAAAFGKPGSHRALVNIGGIANVSLLNGQDLLAGFDTGPGNTLMDGWIERHHGQRCDRDGQWAALGEVHDELLSTLLTHPYLRQQGPRSTGKEAFNLAWLDSQLATMATVEPGDVQATLAEFTARSIAQGIEQSGFAVAAIYVCGGGSHNGELMTRLQRQFPDLAVATTADLGIHPDWVEAAAFAWLASRTLAGMPGNAPAVTGADRACTLGAIYPA